MKETAKQLKLQGQAQVWECEREAWKDKAILYLLLFVKHRAAGETFSAEDFKKSAILVIGKPHHPNVWGSLFRIAAARKWIEKSGICCGTIPASHSHYMYLWKSKL